ncbi:MAG: hypothetical protein M5T52_24995 [Ignavibacteriaceae bacterium]|nr:hypothetical protein [Ignavibacteriaceae bacterium]
MQRSAKVPSNFSDQVSVSVPSELIKRNLSAIYSDIKFFDGQPNPLNAFAYSESKIFKRLSHLPYSNIIQIIKEDLKKLSKRTHLINPYYTFLMIFRSRIL